MSNRDTQFEGFTNLLFDELREAWLVDWKFNDSMRQIIARRAYDLVSHTILNVSIANLDMLSHEECVERIPDMIEWTGREEGGNNP